MPSLDWLEFAQSIVGEPMKVKASAADPCVFLGEGLLMIIYVDDILVISRDSSVGKRVQDLLNEHVPTKMTGIFEPHKVGQVRICWACHAQGKWVETVVCWCHTDIPRFLFQ